MGSHSNPLFLYSLLLLYTLRWLNPRLILHLSDISRRPNCADHLLCFTGLLFITEVNIWEPKPMEGRAFFFYRFVIHNRGNYPGTITLNSLLLNLSVKNPKSSVLDEIWYVIPPLLLSNRNSGFLGWGGGRFSPDATRIREDGR